MVTNLPPDSVAADMDRIFKPLAKRGLANTMPSDQAKPSGKRRGGRNWRVVTFAAPVLVVAASTVLAVGYFGNEGSRTPHAKTATTESGHAMLRSSAAPSAAVQTVALVAPSVRTGSEPIVDGDGNRMPSPRAPAIEPLRRMTTTAPSSQSDPSDRSSGDRGARLAGGAAENARQGRSSGSAGCAPGSMEDRCIYQDVLNADARLRLAYSRARRSGVSVRQLTAINRRWIRAREMSLDDPDGTIERYDALADALDLARREGGE